MTKKTTCAALVAFAAIAVSIVSSSVLRADEGMWLYSNPPTKQIKEKYGVELSPELLENLQNRA